jgi:hypothetical protein
VPWDKVNHRPFLVGLVVDWLFRKWIEEKYPEGWMEYKAETMYNWYEKRKNIIYKNPQDRGKMIKKLKKAVRLLEDAAFNELLPDRVVETNKKVAHMLDGVNWYGKLDLWFPEEKLVWDLKVTESTRYLDPFQLQFFAWLLEQKGEAVQGLAFFSPLMKKSLREHEWSEVERVGLEREIFEIIGLIKDSEWERTAKDCWGCPVVRFCESDFKVESTRVNPKGGFIINF